MKYRRPPLLLVEPGRRIVTPDRRGSSSVDDVSPWGGFTLAVDGNKCLFDLAVTEIPWAINSRLADGRLTFHLIFSRCRDVGLYRPLGQNLLAKRTDWQTLFVYRLLLDWS